MISKTEEYALRAAIHLARRDSPDPVRASELARETGISANYLSKVLHQMARHGVVASDRGRHGGFHLVRVPEEITLAELLAPFAPRWGRARCLLGRAVCSDEDPCPAHELWRSAKHTIADFFEQTTLADVAPKPGREEE